MAQQKPSRIENDWELLVMDVIIPKKAKGQDVKVFAFTPTDTAYFDDLLIEKLGIHILKHDTSSFIDNRDGQRYQIIKVGKDWWMAENLKYKDCNTCSAYENKEQNKALYGCLYDYNDALNAASEGWKLPNDEDWSRLEYILGIEHFELFIEAEKGNNIAYKMKEFGCSGFEVVHAGCYGKGFYNLECSAYF